MSAPDLFASYVREYAEPPRLSATEDWRFQMQDVHDASGQPLDPTGYTLRLQFRPAVLRGMVIADLAQDDGITLTPGADANTGPTITVVSRASGRTWFPLVDAPVVGDLMLYRGDGADADSVFLRRIAFTATWGATRRA